MALTEYNYTKAAALDRLEYEIRNSAILTALDHIDLEATETLSIFFKDALSSGDQSVLSALVSAHSGLPLEIPSVVQIETTNDSDDVPMFRLKMAAEGAKFCFHGIEFETSTLNSVVETKADGTSWGYSSVKLYDINGTQITASENEANCVKTVLSFEPISKNYEIIGGQLNQGSVPTTPIRAWAVGAPTVPEAYGGSIHFLATARCDLAPVGRAFTMDGRVPKYMRYDANYHSSRFDFIFKHNAGVKHSFQIMLELFWP